MSDKAEAAMMIAWLLFVVLFSGDPDLIDALIYWLTDGQLTPQEPQE